MPRLGDSYKKWDDLELSDDSDIETHPNIDTKSMIRWRQRQIHEKREERKQNIAKLTAEIKLNDTLKDRLEAIRSEATTFDAFRHAMQALDAKVPKPMTDPKKATPSHDEMIMTLLMTVAGQAAISPESDRDEAVKSQLAYHLGELDKRTEQAKIELAAEEKESKKHITSEDLHEGFAAGSVNKTPSAQPIDPPKPSVNKGKSKEIEVINSPAVAQAQAAQEADDTDLEELSSTARAFSQIKMGDWTSSYRAISQAGSELLKDSVVDAMLLEAFQLGMAGKKQACMNCTNQALMIQYCGKLGRDGVSLFFKKMRENVQKAQSVFLADVKETFERLWARSQVVAEEQRTGGEEVIQLVAENPDTVISFDVPQGPPPEKLVLEGEGTEDLDVEDVRKYLQRKWDIWQTLAPALQEALKTGSLDQVNVVLGKMPVPEAERAVQVLDEGNILNFRSSEILDQTMESN
ncbi:uncharacterized protein L969DRAFT_96176 [Mixia osmundae IAM 14324]|uniref:Hsp90 chaperone protein kinase-targeting subunit n=1 Tax=Mixia osmundae (strain CBS 9802 / IAM 14324 / JCM 22182 / KY 12970) TaxID=764103 RepID=G7E4S4_MIXOS|nr:uncharacterized protein L969DRAFT_96176 [Mixia osmundae IAM 14324]KEI37654.1 hypothetical protein L969DRAFT_96176 [Mixia osmundae IAM 14324]GAA97834.1 hypothetical protein E5Q_04513 [Mixia osmundae IAM 14324]